MFLLCHSHGGNVALIALNDPGVRAQVTGLVFLNTPFLNRRIRDLGPNGGRWLLGMFGLPTLIAGLAVGKWWPFPVSRWILSGTLGVCGGLVMIFGERYLKRKRAEYTRSAPWVPDQIRTIILRTSSDEASLALAVTQLATWVANRLAQVLASVGSLIEHSLFGKGTRLAKVVKNTFWYLVVYTFVLFLTIYLGDRFGFPTGPLRFIAGWTATIVIYSTRLAFGAMMVTPVPIFLGWVATASALRFAGLADPTEALLYEISVDPTPNGTWQVIQIAALDSARPEEAMRFGESAPPQLAKAFALQHSMAHDDPAALKAISHWLSQMGSHGTK